MDSPFRNHLQYPLNLAALNTPFKALGTDDDKRRFLREATKNLFVRDPYSRMFSAYVDKVFAPNPYYWKEWGIPSVRKSRRGNRGKSVVCGHDVTFAEVMSYAAKRFTNSELHFTSAFRRCKPCEFKYDVIGKMETFAEDLRYLSNRLNLSLAGYFKSAEFRNDINKDAIEDSIASPFSWMHDIRKCMTKHEAGLRIWRKLQIRGIISRRFPLPFSAQSFENVTQEQFIKTALEAHTNSTDAEELKTQKRQAFIEAYRTVDRGVLLEMIKAHKEDFKMFGYDAEPPAVFGPENGDHTTGAFNWQKPWLD
nr:hypothetical protein BaRGS_019489 [Batillaria attramentaria]